MPRMSVWMIVVLGLALGAGVFAGRLTIGGAGEGAEPSEHFSDYIAPTVNVEPSQKRWPIFVNRPEGPPRVDTGQVDELGRPVTISCASCHANIESDVNRRSAETPVMSFHQGLVFNHGELSCLSCHNSNNYNTLRLADGSTVPYPEVMTMCAQCHAPQARDYDRGAHGGMTGHWDLTRGPQHRKSCIDCHDPHAPKYPMMTPTFKPIDRFLEPPRHK